MEPGDIFQYVDLLDTSTSLEQVGVSENRHLAKGLVEACKHANLQTCKLTKPKLWHLWISRQDSATTGGGQVIFMDHQIFF